MAGPRSFQELIEFILWGTSEIYPRKTNQNLQGLWRAAKAGRVKARKTFTT